MECGFDTRQLTSAMLDTETAGMVKMTLTNEGHKVRESYSTVPHCVPGDRNHSMLTRRWVRWSETVLAHAGTCVSLSLNRNGYASPKNNKRISCTFREPRFHPCTRPHFYSGSSRVSSHRYRRTHMCGRAVLRRRLPTSEANSLISLGYRFAPVALAWQLTLPSPNEPKGFFRHHSLEPQSWPCHPGSITPIEIS